MNRSLPLIAAVVLGSAAAGCAPTYDSVESAADQAYDGRQCFTPSMVRNFRQGSHVGQVYVRADRDQVFELNSSGGCTNLDFAVRMAIAPEGPGLAGGRTCTGDSVRLVVPGSTAATSTCRARITRALTAAEVEALPAAQRP